MKQIIISFVAILFFAMVVALNFGLNWVIFGICVCFAAEYCAFSAYERSFTKEYYQKKMAFSRQLLVMHILWCASTLLIAALLGVIGGYDLTEEIPIGNSFAYQTVHQNGEAWWVFLPLLFGRIALQPMIEKAIKENMKLSDNVAA